MDVKKDINEEIRKGEYDKLPLDQLPERIENLKKKVQPIVDEIVKNCSAEKYEKLYTDLTTKILFSYKLNNAKRYLLLYESLIQSKGLRYNKIIQHVEKVYNKIIDQIKNKIKEIDKDYTITDETDVYNVLQDLLIKPPLPQEEGTTNGVANEKAVNNPPPSAGQSGNSLLNGEVTQDTLPNVVPQQNANESNPPSSTTLSTKLTKRSSKISPEEHKDANQQNEDKKSK